MLISVLPTTKTKMIFGVISFGPLHAVKLSCFANNWIQTGFSLFLSGRPVWHAARRQVCKWVWPSEGSATENCLSWLLFRGGVHARRFGRFYLFKNTTSTESQQSSEMTWMLSGISLILKTVQDPHQGAVNPICREYSRPVCICVPKISECK